MTMREDKEQRICPVPYKWNEFWELIGSPAHLQPLILAGWTFSTDRYKRDRFRAQMEYAASTGTKDKADRFVSDLVDREWHTCPEDRLDFDYGEALKEDCELMLAQGEIAQEEVQRARNLYAELCALSDNEAFAPENLESFLSEFWLQFWLVDVGAEDRVRQIEECLRRRDEWLLYRDGHPAPDCVDGQLKSFTLNMQIERLLLKLNQCESTYRRQEPPIDFWQEVFTDAGKA